MSTEGTNDDVDDPRGTGRAPIDGWGRTNPCEHCEEGWFWRSPEHAELFCDSCYRVAHDSPPVHRWELIEQQNRRRGRRQTPPTHEDSDLRATTPLYGGYQHAFFTHVNGLEYAIDRDGDVLVPRKQDWRYDD